MDKMMTYHKLRSLLVIWFVFIAGCAPATTQTHMPPTATLIPPTATTPPPTDTQTPIPITATATPVPTDTPLPSATPTATATETPIPTPWPTAEAYFDGVRVTFINNAGFMITAGDKKVLIDTPLEGYLLGASSPQEIMQRVANAAPPFDQVDLVLATHAHLDHFSAELVSRHLRNNPDAVFVSTREAATRVKGAGDDFTERVISIALETGERQRLTVNDIEIECLHLTHGDDSILNLGFVITIDGNTFFHTGDMNVDSTIGDYVSLSDLQAYGLPQKEIDFAFLQSYMFALEDYQPILFEGIGATYMAPMHYPAAHPPTWIEEDFPDTVIFKDTMHSWVMPSGDGSSPTVTPNADIGQGEILFSVYPNGDISTMNADGGNWKVLIDPPASLEINDNRHASWLPDGSGVSYTVDDFLGNAEIWLMDSQGGNQHILLEGVRTDSSHSWSPDGQVIAYVSTRNQITLYNLADQTLTALTNGSFRSEDDPDWSPDGTRIAFSARESGNQDIYMINVDGTDLTRVTNHPSGDQYPDWSPDGTKIVFSSTRDGDRIKDIFAIDLSQGIEEDGNIPTQITFDDTLDIDPDWSPDGSRIVYATHTFGAAHATLYIMDINGESPFQLTKENTYHSPQWRP